MFLFSLTFQYGITIRGIARGVVPYQKLPNGFAGGCFLNYAVFGGIIPLTYTIFDPGIFGNYFDDVFGVRNPLPGSWNDEFRASYYAALNAPNLSDKDRMYLMLDALERAKEAGVYIKITDEIRRILYGY